MTMKDDLIRCNEENERLMEKISDLKDQLEDSQYELKKIKMALSGISYLIDLGKIQREFEP